MRDIPDPDPKPEKVEICNNGIDEIFMRSITVPDNRPFGLKGSELIWDGTFNGKLVEPGVYTYTLKIKSCTRMAHECDGYHCPSNESGDWEFGDGSAQYCSRIGDNNRNFKGSITVVR